MARLSTISQSEAADAIRCAAESKVGATVTVCHQDRWIMFISDMLDVAGGYVWITYPRSDHGPEDFSFCPGQRVGVTFRNGFQRFIFSANIEAVEESGGPALKLNLPEELQVGQRRAGPRVEMSVLATIEASIWLGGWRLRSEESDEILPVWSGRVVDLSEGGCYVRISPDVSEYIEIGDIVGLQLTIGGGEKFQEILLDAQLCRSDPDGEMLMVGLGFIESDGSEQACEAREKIKAELRDF